jgi:hypothetical protein
MARKQTERLFEKTIERQFLHELETDFELAPATSRAVLETAQQVLLLSSRNGDVREGQMRVTAVIVEEPSGKPLSTMKRVGMGLSGFGSTRTVRIEAYLRLARLLLPSGKAR